VNSVNSRRLKTTLERHNIVPFYVPGACTDEIQECDTVLNKPFKAGVKESFRDYLHAQYNDWVDCGKDPDVWVPSFTMSVLKPHVTGWVKRGLEKISTPEMKEALVTAFKTDGRFQDIRSIERQFAAGVEELEREFVQLQVDEEPEDVQEISAAGHDELVAGDYEEPDADSAADSLPTEV
jgi:hypothetical protein